METVTSDRILSNELVKLYPHKFQMDPRLGLVRWYNGRWLTWDNYLKAVTSNRNGMLGLSPNN